MKIDETKNLKISLTKLLINAKKLNENRLFKEACIAFNEIIKLPETKNSIPIYVDALLQLSKAQILTFSLKKAENSLKKAQNLIANNTKILAPFTFYKLRYCKVQIEVYKENFDLSIDLLTNCIKASNPFEKTNLHDIVDFYDSRAECFYRLGNSQQSLNDIKEIEKLYIKYNIKDASKWIRVNWSLSNYLFNLYNFESALKYLDKSLKIANAKLTNSKSDQFKKSKIYASLTKTLIHTKDFYKAILFGQKAIALLEPYQNEKIFGLPILYSTIAIAYGSIGNIDKELEYKLLALKTYKKNLGPKHTFIGVLNSKFFDFYIYKKQDLKKAVVHLKKAEKILNLKKNLRFQIDVKLQFVVYYNFINKPKTALKQLLDGLKLLKNADVKYFEKFATLYQLQSKTYIKLGNLKTAQKQIDLAIKTILPNAKSYSAKAINLSLLYSPTVLQNILISKAKVHALLYETNKASKDFEIALAFFKQYTKLSFEVRNKFTQQDSKVLATETDKTVYNKVINLLYLKYEENKESEQIQNLIFRYFTLSKASVLNDKLQAEKSKHISNLPKKFIDAEKKLALEISFTKKQIDLNEDKKDNKEFLKQLKVTYFELVNKYDNLISNAEKNYPNYVKNKFQTRDILISQVKQKLTSSEILIEYFISDKHIYTFIITKNNNCILKQEIPKDFYLMLATFPQLVFQNIKKHFVNLANQLFKILIESVLPFINKKIKKLIIIPDAKLATIPFETFINTIENKSIKDPNFLIFDYEIVYHFSSALWHSVKTNVNKEKPNLKYLGIAPINYKSNISAMLRTASDNLQFSKMEIEKVLEQFDANESIKLIKTDANVKKIFETLNEKSFKYIHIAAHGFANPNLPEYSGIILSKPKKNNAVLIDKQVKNSNVLHLADAYNLNLKNTDLIILSCCESGIGKIAKGEGMIAMNRGFFFAGAKNIIYTLFKVYDKSSSQLAVSVFKFIAEGDSYASALRKAKLELIKQNYSPIHWAGFVLMGE